MTKKEEQIMQHEKEIIYTTRKREPLTKRKERNAYNIKIVPKKKRDIIV